MPGLRTNALPWALMRAKREAPSGAWTKEQGKESRLQTQAMQAMYPVIVERGIHRELLMHPPNGRDAGGPAQGAHWKKMGVVAGYPDILFFHPGHDSANVEAIGMAIELKIWPAEPTPEQVLLHTLLRRQGWVVHVAYGVEECKQHMVNYIRNIAPQQ